MNNVCLKAPFPYFGGKSKVAHLVWKYLGQPKHYIEPFFGSGAVLLQRPDYNPERHVETVNDKDGFICNVWRSLKFSPEKTAEWADWPVNHADLSARKLKLVKSEGYLLENLVKDDEWHDPKLAGYWIWAASCWIGSGLTRLGQIPHIGTCGNGIHGQRPHISTCGNGIHGQRPHIAKSGNGIHGQIPFIAHVGIGIHTQETCSKSEKIYAWFNLLSQRLRNVRVVCGDWNRVCGGNWQDAIGVCGMFFDPPYGRGVGKRQEKLYHHDSFEVSGNVRKWCLERGKLESYRIVLAGYEGEHNELENYGWKKIEWKANGGYANVKRKTNSSARGKENAKLERLWISPHCLNQENNIDDLFFETQTDEVENEI